ncbi:class II aldolase/adducin family protein [Corynebacterium anserum]|uniref:Class II aldolase/adducin N-terminal domain-containing protein n=1 Tax=Corynebacterium anserum TaxID=2684406 RepID=A0A7G7YMK7_9CORY|nr:class II aldolase/adducin family protein [Corynebacterium anserum]QNH95727.1 hypothetical protein GP473_02690 [Corynebacterium anserum]
MKDPRFSQRSAVVDLSRDLLHEGLVVRTWGNVSHRTSGHEFVITPSGRSYDTMIESDLAVISAAGEASGPFKPSSEYPMHKLCYEHRPGANCVVHTHQRYASALSQLGQPLELTRHEAQAIGQSHIQISPYGLPSTKKLHFGVKETLRHNPGDNVVLLEAHGVFLCGDTAEHALQLARDVESAATRIYKEVTGSTLVDPDVPQDRIVRSERDNPHAPICFFNAAGEEATASVPAEVRARHEAIYSQRKKACAIRVCWDSEVEALKSQISGGTPLRPYLDDFAQIVGTKAHASARANVVFRDGEALCIGSDPADATAVESVLMKNARAARVAQVAGRSPIANWECHLMNAIYRATYSKQA